MSLGVSVTGNKHFIILKKKKGDKFNIIFTRYHQFDLDFGK
jgi:hypothetical protein